MSNQQVMLRQLAKNPNTEIMKQVITNAAKTVQQRVYWWNTCQDEGGFLRQYWDKQINVHPIMKNRIAKITQQKFDQLFAEVQKGKFANGHGLEVFHIGNLNLSTFAQDIPVYDHKYFSQNHPKTKQTQAKIKEIQQDYLKFKQKIQQIKRKEIEKKRSKQFMQNQQRQNLQKQKKQKYRQYVSKSIQAKSIQQQERKKQNQKYKQFIKVYKGVKPLYALMEEEYKQKFQLPMLQQKKRKLQEIKKNVKPTLEQINEHQMQYLQQKQDRPSRIFIANKTIDVSFKSKFYQEAQKKYYGQDEQYQTVFDQVQKKKRYSDLVKQHFKPRVSTRLRQSINQSQLKNSTMIRQSLDRHSTYEKGVDYLQYVRMLQKNKKQHSSPSERDLQDEQTKKKTNRYTNYLQQLKSARQSHELNDSQIQNQWEKDMRNKNLSDHERRQRILMKSKQLQQKAQRKQQYVNNFNFEKAETVLDKKKEIDDTLISAIRAKVAVLKQAHQL